MVTPPLADGIRVINITDLLLAGARIDEAVTLSRVYERQLRMAKERAKPLPMHNWRKDGF